MQSVKVFGARLYPDYDRSADILYLHARGLAHRNPIGHENEAGVIEFYNYATKRFIGVTILDAGAMQEKRQAALDELGIKVNLRDYCEPLPPDLSKLTVKELDRILDAMAKHQAKEQGRVQ
jgi:hypothetical protein